MEPTTPFGLGRRLRLGILRESARRIDRRFPRVGKRLHQVKQGLETGWATNLPEHRDALKLESLYQQDGEILEQT